MSEGLPKLQTQGRSFLSFSLSLPHTLHGMTMTRMLSTVSALDGGLALCLALCLTLGIGCVPVFLSVCLTSLRVCLSFSIAVCTGGHCSWCLPAKPSDADQAGAQGTSP